MSQSQQNNYGGTNFQTETGQDNTNYIGATVYNNYYPASQPSEEPIPFNVPFPRSPYFTGREDLLTQLHAVLQQKRAAALSGLGGIGKTQTAVEYAYHYFNDQPVYQWVFWIRAETELELSTDFANLARALALPQQEAQEIEQKIEAVKRWFANHKDWLLIFDNADHPELLQKFRPQNPQGCVLVTSRAPVLDAAGIADVQKVLKLHRQESIEMLLKRTGQAEDTNAEQIAAEKLAAEMDDLPLALEQAGAYIREQQIRIQDYWTAYQRRRLQLLEQHPTGVNYPASVTTTWAINFQAVQNTNPAAADVLQLSALLAADAIPYELLIKGAKHLGKPVQNALAEAETNPLQLANVLQSLARYSLVKLEPATQSYSIHRLVQAVLQQAMTAHQKQQWVNRAIAALNAAFPDVDYDQWSLCARLLPQVESIQLHLFSSPGEGEALGRLLNRAGGYLDQRGEYQKAEPLLLHSLEIREAKLGTDHPDVAISLNNLALLYKNKGKYDQAEPLYLKALEIRETKLGIDHPDVATSLNNLALLYKNKGKYDQAEPLYLKALEIREAKLGIDHPDVATSLNNLALLYKNKGKYDQAEPLYLKALEIREAKLGIDHPSVATSLHNLASLYDNQRKYNQAEPLYLKALEIREAKLGIDHPSVATSLNNLASLYDNQGKYDQAEPLFLRALEIREAKLGIDHPSVATSLHNLASLYDNQGKYDQAEPLYLKALEIREAKLGIDHPSVATSLYNLASLYDNQGKYDQAEPLYLKALEIDERCYGEDHPEVATDFNSLAGLYKSQGRYSDAEPLYVRAISISEQRLGTNHPDTVLYRDNLQRLKQETAKASRSSQVPEPSSILILDAIKDKIWEWMNMH